jgi:hypothetical protein
MKGFVIAVFSALMVVCGSTYSNCLTDYIDLYVGADGQVRHMKFNSGFGDNILRKSSPQANIYAGVKITENSAIEIGYETTITKGKKITLKEGDIINGYRIPREISPIVFETKAKVKGLHFDWIFFNKPFECSKFQLLGSVGISSLKGTVERKTVQIGYPPRYAGRNRTMSKRSAALRFTGGWQYYFDSGFGVRNTFSFVRTGKMVIKADDGIPGIVIPKVLPKDSLVVGLGVLYHF